MTKELKQQISYKKNLILFGKSAAHRLHSATRLCYLFSVDGNRTECVNRLRQLLMTVHKNDLLKFGEEVLLKSCNNNTVCSDERNLVIDIFAREGSTETQNLILKLVMTHPNVTEEEIRRCLFHCVALKDPIHVSKQY